MKILLQIVLENFIKTDPLLVNLGLFQHLRVRGQTCGRGGGADRGES